TFHSAANTRASASPRAWSVHTLSVRGRSPISISSRAARPGRRHVSKRLHRVVAVEIAPALGAGLYHHPKQPDAPILCDFGVEVTRTFETAGEVYATETPGAKLPSPSTAGRTTA